MFGKLFSKKEPAAGYCIVARLNDRAQPLDRGDLYEDPLDEILKKHDIGEVTGGGTQLGEAGEIEYCDVEIHIKVAPDKAIDVIKGALEELGAPKGSKLLLESEGGEVPFGINKGLAVYLNGTDLPDEVYAECDADFVVSEFNRLLGSEGKMHSHWQGPTETALYFYGKSVEAMKLRLQDFINTYPLCQKARIVQIA